MNSPEIEEREMEEDSGPESKYPPVHQVMRTEFNFLLRQLCKRRTPQEHLWHWRPSHHLPHLSKHSQQLTDCDVLLAFTAVHWLIGQPVIVVRCQGFLADDTTSRATVTSENPGSLLLKR
ncbi:hypothetical protein C0Q70_16136 [Pomacea canaliculata]|uniref:Uncharacterized protein n=1 Tax=Pomacea canaliculata TaxID=400727 RepID=A0A2T7NNY1_POMCA|nr:hypothetical protein C0Q70_16136 [Pomacea canaliculata]